MGGKDRQKVFQTGKIHLLQPTVSVLFTNYPFVVLWTIFKSQQWRLFLIKCPWYPLSCGNGEESNSFFDSFFKPECDCRAGDGSAPPEELRRTLGRPHTAGHPMPEQADRDRRPQEAQLHPGSGTAAPPPPAFSFSPQSVNVPCWSLSL